MKIEVKETAEEKFPAVFKDKVGNVWIWADKYSYICFDKDDEVEIDVSNDRFEFNFDELNDTWKFVRVYGTITITV